MNIVDKIKQQLNKRMILFIILGIAGGFGYYYFVGCTSGSCPITSNPYSSMLYGALIGLVAGIK